MNPELRILTLLCCVVLTAASAFANAPVTIDLDRILPGAQGEDVLANYDPDFPARGGDVDWGLALSGGGLRSAAFSIGAMKALYDLGLLDDIDVISSVSGGGYASYWLYSRYLPEDTQNFGHAAFRNDLFSRNVCTLGAKSNFFPFSRMIAAVFSPRDRAFRKYRDSIEWSFGPDHWRSRKHIRETGESNMRRLRHLVPAITAGRAPYFIINATIETDKGRQGQKLTDIEKTFEIGPTYRGSTALGFSEWKSDDTGINAWCNATAMSGAGIRFKFSRKIADYDEPDDKDRIDLADGGLSENLAALPLIRRGVKNIIIVDAENDPGYKFVSYCNLRKHLRERNIALAVRAIDSFFDCDTKRHTSGVKRFTATAVAQGTATYAGGVSKIFYIKMSRPASIFPQSPGGRDAIGDEKHRRDIRPSGCRDGQVEHVTSETLRREMHAYSRYLNEDWPWGKFFEFLPWINYNFPQITTIDQTFYNDQLKAFIGLGYLETIEMGPIRGK